PLRGHAATTHHPPFPTRRSSDLDQEQNELGLLTRKINQLLDSIERNRSGRREAEASLLHLSRHDQLTGLPNRSLMLEQLSRVLSDAHRRQRNAAVLCCGLDDFKTINEKFSY